MKFAKYYRLIIGLALIIIIVVLFHDFFRPKSVESNYFGVNLNLLVKGDLSRSEQKTNISNPVKAINSEKGLKCRGIIPNRSQFKVTIDGVTYPNIVPLYHNTSIDFECLASSNKTKTILMWTKFKGSPLIDYGFGVQEPFKHMNCPVTNCELTQDRTKFKDSDLVLFHLRNNIDFIPERVKPNQRFVHVIFESPINCHLCASNEGVFNYSVSYRDDSDFSSIYWTDANIYWAPSDKMHQNSDPDVHSTKKLENFASILASNCNSNSQRENIVAELSRFIKVDIFGKCGSNQCPSDSKVNCREYLAKKYMFYLAFENSLCYGYITEKIFDTLSFNVIPVVMGYANYSYYLPKSGYINALDFASPKNLADYLMYLAQNKTAYNSYFAWKKFIKIDSRKSIGGYLCEMCIKLQLEENTGIIERKQLKNMKKTFGLFENCLDINLLDVKYYNITNLTRPIYSYYMSPER